MIYFVVFGTLIKRKKEYGLLGAVNKGLIPCIADGGMRGLAEELNPNGVNETCNWHTLGRLGLRTRENCLRLFDDAQEEKLDEIFQLEKTG